MSPSIEHQIPIAMITMCVNSFIGCVGNGIVILIYCVQRNENCTVSLFIFVLAVIDFSTCLCVIPFTVVNEFLLWYIGSPALCFIYYVLNTFNVPFSSLLTSCVAIDRYCSICHPFHQIFTVHRAKILIISLGLFSLFLAITTTQFAFLSMAELASNISQGNKSEYKCTDPSQLTFHTVKSAHLKMFYILLKINHSCYVFCIIVVILLYILIYRAIILLRYRKRQLQGRIDAKSHEMMSSFMAIRKSEVAIPNISLVGLNPNENYLKIPQIKSGSFACYSRSSCCSRNFSVNDNFQTQIRSISKSLIKDSDLLQNIRSAIMLFVVAIVYITSFIPALLMANKMISLNLAVFYLYYVNNAANPIIYCFMNQQFRADFKRLMKI
uniref:GCR075 n=1 Tax=Schmidtea mediterranea TaxID=79327 RepID=A0A193KU98_SCHMD|nr:GCR075 [Schmidtea mediterranea]